MLVDLRVAKEITLFGLGPGVLRRPRAETEQAQRLDPRRRDAKRRRIPTPVPRAKHKAS
jgi:hypothetical protein